MPSQDMCPLYPSFRRSECGHCRNGERITLENPRVSIEEKYLNGHPVVEVLKNGGPVHLWDREFQFGLRKAEMLISCISLIKRFWQSSDDDDRRAFAPCVIENHTSGLRVRVYVEMRPDFVHSSGKTIDRPWLCLQSLAPDDERLGLGVMKCRAICAVQEELKRWLRKSEILV